MSEMQRDWAALDADEARVLLQVTLWEALSEIAEMPPHPPISDDVNWAPAAANRWRGQQYLRARRIAQRAVRVEAEYSVALAARITSLRAEVDEARGGGGA